MGLEFGVRRAVVMDISTKMTDQPPPFSEADLSAFSELDAIYRSMCAVMFNYVPMSGHPGGSISCGRFVACLLFDGLDCDVSKPERSDADLVSYAAGHKALGLYAMWALRNEIIRLGAPELLPEHSRFQLRLEDLLGFRRNPVTKTPIFLEKQAKALDGHPTPATPFVKLSTGASGVGLPTSLGLALGAADYYGPDPPIIHIIEGEGGLTPGRAAEAMAGAGTASLGNAILHVDWNQASIDSEHVCRDEDGPGDYVQWTPAELAYLNDWNVITVDDGTDFQQIAAAQRQALTMETGQPTAIIYRTTKGWRYGIEGRKSHGAGHKLCSADFYASIEPLEDMAEMEVPRCDANNPPCRHGGDPVQLEACYWEALCAVRRTIEARPDMVEVLSRRLRASLERLNSRRRAPRRGAPKVEAVYEHVSAVQDTPEHLKLDPGSKTTLRGELGKVLGHLNQISEGSLMIASADLLGSTSVASGGKGFDDGFWNARTNNGARLITVGGICEDAITAMMSGLSSYGRHIGVGSSYGAFIAALGHIASRLHAIGNQARQEVAPGPYHPYFLVLAHAGLKTGEDGPTHADPQALQLVQENFPRGTMITLTPWDPAEIWYLVCRALELRPAIIAPVVTRPSEIVLDREAIGLAPAKCARSGVYRLKASSGKADATIVLQGSEVTYAFITDALPRLSDEGLDVEAYSISSAEIFDLLPPDEREAIFPDAKARSAMGITGFTLPTMYRWITSERGRQATLYPYQKGRYLGSGPGHRVLEEAGLDGKSQFEAIRRYAAGSGF